MSKHHKAIDKLRRNPLHVRYEEAESILLHLGFSKGKKVRTMNFLFENTGSLSQKKTLSR